jgi:hypothetical protein
MPTITRMTAMIHRIVVMPQRVPALRRPHTSAQALVGRRTAQAPDVSGRDAGTRPGA